MKTLNRIIDWFGRQAERIEHYLLPPPIDVTANIEQSSYHVVADQVSISEYNRRYETVRHGGLVWFVVALGLMAVLYLMIAVIQPRQEAGLQAQIQQQAETITELRQQIATLENERDNAVGQIEQREQRIDNLEKSNAVITDSLSRSMRVNADTMEVAKRAVRQAVTARVTHESHGRVDVEAVTDALFRQIEHHNVPVSYWPDLTDAVLDTVAVESAWRVDAVSSAGAEGLMQVLPTYHTLPGVDECQGQGIERQFCAGIGTWLFYLKMCRGNRECAHVRYNGAWEYDVSANQYLVKIRGVGS